jgi:hypothetical protein
MTPNELNDLKTQIELINKLKNAKRDLLRKEEEQNKDLVRLINSRKREVDVLTTLSDVYSDLADKEDELMDKLYDIRK